MNHIITCSALLFSLLFVSIGTADQSNCSKDDVIGRWTTYSIDLGVADHVEYQEKIVIEFLQTLDGADQFYVSFPGAFSNAINPWIGKCEGDQYVLEGDIQSHDNIHSIQAARNSAAPLTDQCSLERCELTCIDDLLAECSISKSILDGKLTFMILPGHAEETGGSDLTYSGSEPGCTAHDCNHPGNLHVHGPG